MNMAFCTLLLLQIQGSMRISWWLVFGPQWLCHSIQVPMYILVLLATTQMIELQLGPPPPVTASTGMQLQYAQLKRMRIRTHIIDNLLGIIESLTTVAVKVGNVMNSTAVTARLCL
eukprot:jgi/Chrzof1/5220/Cz15g17070.t1